MVKRDGPVQFDAKTRMLNAAIAQIDAHGDASLGVVAIAAAAEVTPALISHHFGGRDGLVAAAHAHRFESMAADDVAMFIRVVEAGVSREDAAFLLAKSLPSVVSRQRAPNRLRGLSALAAAHGRPELRVEFSQTVAGLIDGCARFVQFGQTKGIFRTELDARATGTIVLSMAFGSLVADLDASPASQDDLKSVFRIIIESFYVSDARNVEPSRIDPTVEHPDAESSGVGSSGAIESPDPNARLDTAIGSSGEAGNYDRILDAAINAIDRDGDTALRVSTVTDEAGVSLGMIKYCFGSREGLVDAAQQERFKRLIGSGIKPFTDILNSHETPEDKTNAYRLAFMASVSRDLAETRLLRASSIAAVQGRPELQVAVSKNVTMFIDTGQQLLELGQQTEVFRPDIDARAAGTIVMGLGFGLIIADFDARPASEDDLRGVVGCLVDSLFLSPPTDTGDAHNTE
jgi:AcrR family transcriptional regulator